MSFAFVCFCIAAVSGVLGSISEACHDKDYPKTRFEVACTILFFGFGFCSAIGFAVEFTETFA